MKKFDSKETIAAIIPVDEMIIDKTYQGHLNDALTERIAHRWDNSSAGAVILNLREDDTYAVLDGQHRVTAARKAGVKELAALVFIGKSHEEEARLYVELNTKHNVTPLDRFRAKLTAGTKREKEILLAAQELGLKIESNPGPTSIRGVVALTRMYDNFGLSHIKMVLGTLQATFGSYEEVATYAEEAILGMSGFIARYPNADLKKFIEKVRKHSPTTVRGMAKARVDLGQSAWIGWGRTVTSIYNKGLHGAAVLNPDLWNKAKFSPKGREKQSQQMKKLMTSPKGQQLKKYQFQKGVKPKEQPSILAAAAKGAK